MASKIVGSSLAERLILNVTSSGISFTSGAALSRKRKFRFDQIDHIVLSENGKTLGFQVGKEVFSIPVKPQNKKHQQVIDNFVEEVHNTQK